MITMVFENQVIKEIITEYRALWALDHALSLLSWDSETYMPRGGVEERGIATAELRVLWQKLLLQPKLAGLVEKASGLEGLNEYERGVVRVLGRKIRIYKKIPPKLLAELAETTEKAKSVWREAKEKNDYRMFEPWLAKIVELNRKMAEHLGYEDHPYDALLDLHEEGMRTRDVEKIFNAIAPALKKILERVLEEDYYPKEHPLEQERYEKKCLERVNFAVLDALGYPWDRGRLDVSPHPFTINMGIGDVRITTRYEGFDFKRSLLAVVHEFGHALYELQVDERLKATPLANGVSMGIHESQSRFWENMVGRTREFVEAIYPLLQQELPFIRKYDAEEVYRYFNTVRPSLIRTEADEVTYNFHILLRFQLEKMLIAGEIRTSDIPELWSEMMDEYLGVKPSSHSEGVLQDIHWSMGSIGYFPSYTIGTIVAAQLKAHMLKEIPETPQLVRNKNFKPIREWLREKIHKWGSTFPPKELLRKAIGEEINTDHFINYLEEKYLREIGHE